LLSAALLVLFNFAAETVTSKSLAAFLRSLSVVAGVFAGASATVMFIEYFAREQMVAPIGDELAELRIEQEQLTSEVKELIDLVQVERESGYRRHYTDRRRAFVEIYKAVKDARKRAWFLGISNSIFEDLRNLQDMIGEDNPDERFHEALISCMQKDCHVQFLYLARAKAELYLAREEAERGGRPESLNDCQLFRDTLVSLNLHTLRLYCEAVREEVEDKIEIREYSLAPTLSVIIIDDRLFVGAYTARQCKDIPVQEYTLEVRLTDLQVLLDSQLYFEHFMKYANDDHSVLTTPKGRLTPEGKERVLNGDAWARGRLEQWDREQRGPYEEMIDKLKEWLAEQRDHTGREAVG
jgi:hypothetical protein